MKFISYAQNFEDVMLRRALKRVKKGFYVDVGAQDPVRDSVSKAFYEMGWHGINIEPVSIWFDKLSVDRPRDINLRVAASSSDGEVTLYEVKDSGLSTMDVDYAKNYSHDGMEVVEHSVQTRTLSSILADASVQEIHFLKVDVEGAEESVLRGMDFSKYRPWIILVEARLPNSTRDAFRSWESLIVSAGYTFAWDDGLNRFYYANEHRRLARAFKLPPNVFDQFVTYDESHLSELSRWAHELETRLAQAEDVIATQAGLAAQLEAQHQDLLKLDAALQEAQASQSVVMADRDEVTRW
ncbi:FkbM family methyltransferase, partial [Rhodanobacter sp. B2A1Ga4]|uniref:FkbM family methyltransferase n=1 Tax=Rhodanobacter sp. B2A1Ga4 TaxID=2778647 RepID=UPI001B37118A|nr:FkbM family methyltransferase [Rhodanobacter sp. B2A1Ga4]